MKMCSKLVDRAKAALAKSKIPDLRRLTIVQDSDRIVVRGRLSSFYHLQLAQKQLRRELGDTHIANEVQVF
jgi:hypothetical protein